MCRTQVTQVMFLVTCLNGTECYAPQTATHPRFTVTGYVLEPDPSFIGRIPRCISFTKKCLEDLRRDGTSTCGDASTWCVCTCGTVRWFQVPIVSERPPYATLTPKSFFTRVYSLAGKGAWPISVKTVTISAIHH